MGSLLQKLPSSELMATVELLDHHGITREHLTRLRADSEFANRITEFIRLEGRDVFVHHKPTRILMRKNFFGIEEWTVFYRTNFSQKQLRQVAEFPWGEEILASTCPLCGSMVNNCHFAFLGLDRLNDQPLTIFKFQELYSGTSEPRFKSYPPDSWYSKENFATGTTMSFRWYLLHKNIVLHSEHRTYDRQKAMLPAEYEVPYAITEVAKDLLIFEKSIFDAGAGTYVNCSHYGRCADVASDGDIVYIGFSEDDNLFIHHDPANLSHYRIGLAASRKLPSAV